MHPLPQTKTQWLRTAVLPFQAYVVTSWFASATANRLAGRDADDASEILYYGYWLAAFALGIGAWLQKRNGDLPGSVFSTMTVFVVIILSHLCLPVLR